MPGVGYEIEGLVKQLLGISIFAFYSELISHGINTIISHLKPG